MLFLVVWRYGLDDDIMRNSAHRLSHGSISPESSGRWNEKSKNLSTILLGPVLSKVFGGDLGGDLLPF